MISGVFSTLGAKSANERRLEIISNNIANSVTPGYKASRPVFSAVTLDEGLEPDQLHPTNVNISDYYIHFSDAPLVETGGRLDLAIEGNGFFVVSTPNGNMYTRNGQFTLSKDKKLVTQDGNPVFGESGSEIVIDGKEITVEIDGSISVDKTRVDKLKIVDFKNKTGLQTAGRSLFVNTNQSNDETTPENVSVRQGFYEASNVDVVKEMIELIVAIRAYESCTKADELANESLTKLIDAGRI
jgi:flagellar basal-body rod protein FlgF